MFEEFSKMALLSRVLGFKWRLERPRAAAVGAAPRCLTVERARRLDAIAAGWLQADRAPVWVTIQGQLEDWVLLPGDRLPLERGDHALVEPLRAGSLAELCWHTAPTR